MSWHRVGRPQDLRFDPGAAVTAAGRRIAIFRDGEGFLAIDNVCPHASAPLCDGSVRDGRVACMLHLWEFDLRTGACDMGPQWNVETFPVRLAADGELEVEVAD